jgi:hypothetical protein
MSNPTQGRSRQKEMSGDTKKQMARSMEFAEFKTVLPDSTTNSEKRPCFAQSAERHILDKQPGFGEVIKPSHSHSKDRGLNTFNSDTRDDPLPGVSRSDEMDSRIDIDTCMPRNNEHQIVGKETAPENTVS